MKKLFLIGTASLALLAACGDDTETTHEEADEETETTESTDKQDEQENNKEDEKSEDEESKDTELSEDEAEEKAREYINENEDYNADDYVISMREEDDAFIAIVHAGIKADEKKGNPILYQYKVDRISGKVEETNIGSEKQDAHVSEIVSMSQEEKDEHYREIAQNPDKLDERVLAKLLLPGLHENTKEYEGRINPDDTIGKVSLKTADDPSNNEEINTPDVDEEGYFTIYFSENKLKNSSVLTIIVSGDDYNEQIFEIPINEIDNKMDYIRVH